MFELQITDTDITGGSIPVSWCLNKETLDKIIAEYGPDPSVVLIVAPTQHYHLSKEKRKIVPLRDLMAYLDFKTAGPNRIWAFITKLSTKDARKAFLDYWGFISPDGDEWGSHFRKDDQDFDDTDYQPAYGTYVDIDIPKSAFAPEPAPWEKNWVNLFFSKKPIDQCNFRRRRILAYTLQPIIMFLYIVMRAFITLVALLFGARNFSLQPLFHPLSTDMEDQISVFGGGTIFIRKNPPIPKFDATKSNLQNFLIFLWVLLRKAIFLPFMPPILFLIVFTAIVSSKLIFILTLICVVLVSLFIIVILIAFFADGGLSKLQDWIDNKFGNKDTGMLSEEEIRLLVCSPDRQPVTMDNLPANKKSIKLRFADLKSKVCRPFSA